MRRILKYRNLEFRDCPHPGEYESENYCSANACLRGNAGSFIPSNSQQQAASSRHTTMKKVVAKIGMPVLGAQFVRKGTIFSSTL